METCGDSKTPEAGSSTAGEKLKKRLFRANGFKGCIHLEIDEAIHETTVRESCSEIICRLAHHMLIYILLFSVGLLVGKI